MSEIVATYLIHDFNGNHEKKAEEHCLRFDCWDMDGLAPIGTETTEKA